MTRLHELAAAGTSPWLDNIRRSWLNSGRFREEIRRLASQREPKWIVLQCEAITDVDVTAAEMLELLDRELNAAGVHLAFVELRDRLKQLTLRYGLMDTLDKDHFYPSIESAVAAIRSEETGA